MASGDSSAPASASLRSASPFQWPRDISPAERKSLIAGGLGWMLDAMDVMLYSFVLAYLMTDLRSAGEMSRGHWKGEAERKDADAGAEESPDAISSRYRPVSVWRAQCFQRCAEPEGPALTSPAKGGRPRRKTRFPRQER